MNKIKCLNHNQLSFGQVGQINACIQCKCDDMVYCQNIRHNEISTLIEFRLKIRGEIKKMNQQKYKLTINQKRLETQYIQDLKDNSIQQLESDQEKLMQEDENEGLKIMEKQLNQQQKKQQQISELQEKIKSNDFIILNDFEEKCTHYLETIISAEFIYHHISQRKKWTTDNLFKIIQEPIIQQVFHRDQGYNLFCNVVGNKIEKNKPLQGYWKLQKDIVYIHSIIYDGYWMNGLLLDGTISYLEQNYTFQSYDASTIINKYKGFTFGGIIKFQIFQQKDHFKYLFVNDELINKQRSDYLKY